MTDKAKFVIGYAGTWLILSLLADIRSLQELASALAISIAVTASFVFIPSASANVFNIGKVS